MASNRTFNDVEMIDDIMQVILQLRSRMNTISMNEESNRTFNGVEMTDNNIMQVILQLLSRMHTIPMNEDKIPNMLRKHKEDNKAPLVWTG